MSKMILTSILIIFLSVQAFSNQLNPKPYAALGDVIYNNVENIDKLITSECYSLYTDEIKAYVKDVNKAKEEGFALESKSSTKSKKLYLAKLRELSLKNDNYLRDIKNRYKLSMKNNNYELFSKVINSGIIDLEKNKQEIVDYYYLHSDDINSTGVIDNYLNEDAKLKALKDAQRKKYKSKKTLREEKIKRIRAADIEAQKKLEIKLQKDVMNKKLQIREDQKRELAH